MKRLQALLAMTVVTLSGYAAAQDIVTSGNGGMTVIDTVTTPIYGTTTTTWLADANLAASLTSSSPYWVPGINPDGSMSLGTAINFISQLNKQSYLNINTWRLPESVPADMGCGLPSGGGRFGYNCGTASPPTNNAYPYSQLGGLFYNVLGGQAHGNITTAHNANYNLFNNVQPYLYWSGTQQTNNSKFAYDFWFQNGFQGTENAYDSMFVLPVSTTTTGTPPPEIVAAGGVLPGLGLTTAITPAIPTLQRSADGALVYDPRLNVTFLSDANLARSLAVSPSSPYYVSGLDSDGSMNAPTLVNFLKALNNTVKPYLGLKGWTVPLVAQDGLDSSCTLANVSAGQHQAGGYNCGGLSPTDDGQASSLGELFYDQLGGVAGVDIATTSNGDASFFSNLQLNYYWQCQPLPSDPPGQCDLLQPGGNPSFSFLSGYQGSQTDPNVLYAMLEVPGNALNSAAVPEPVTWAIMMVGIGALVGIRTEGSRPRR